jgi:hypothetical protein
LSILALKPTICGRSSLGLSEVLDCTMPVFASG